MSFADTDDQGSAQPPGASPDLATRYRSLVEQSLDAIYFVDSEGFFVDVNDATCKLFGYTRAEILGMHLSDIIDPDDLRATPLKMEALRSGQHLRMDRRIRRKDGSALSVDFSARMLSDGLIQAIARDVTERRRLEQVQHSVLAQFKLAETVFTHGISCQVILDRDFNFVRVNPAYARACRKDISEFAGCNHFEMYPSDARHIFEDVVRTKRPFEVIAREFSFPDRPELGSTYWDWTLVPVLDQCGEVEYLVFSLNEVTERKLAEAEILKARENMQILSARLIVVQEEERARISRELHAEIGQSMTALKLALRTMQKHWSADANAARAEAALQKCIQITDATINQVRNLSLQLRPPHLDDLGLEEALSWLLDTHGQAAEWACELNVDPSLGRVEPEIEAACFRIAQEALTNAARHANAKNVAIALRVVGDELRLAIRDDGRGFDPEATERRRGRRAGLGLVSMQERAMLAGGNVSVRRLEQGGTEVLATLPLRRAEG